MQDPRTLKLKPEDFLNPTKGFNAPIMIAPQLKLIKKEDNCTSISPPAS